MYQKTALTIQLELLWWLVTFLILAGVLYPIYRSEVTYPFWVSNAAFLVAFITLARYIFLLKHTFLAYWQVGKVIVFALSIPLFIYLFTQMTTFQLYLEEVGLEAIFVNMPMDEQGRMIRYVRNEMLFFGTASIIAALIMPFRMLISFWRTHNRGTV